MLIETIEKTPGGWTERKIGKSGTHYKLSYLGTQLIRLSVLTAYKPMPGEPLYWKIIWSRNQRHLGVLSTSAQPRSRKVLDAFADLGWTKGLHRFINGRHVRLVR